MVDLQRRVPQILGLDRAGSIIIIIIVTAREATLEGGTKAQEPSLNRRPEPRLGRAGERSPKAAWCTQRGRLRRAILMRCNNTDGMPRGDFNIYFASSRRGFVRAEEAVGVALLVIILAALILLGCWYFKRRGGYKKIRSSRSGSPAYTGGQYSEAGPSAQNKMALDSFGSLQTVMPNAPPAYEKILSGPLPPPYSP